MSKTLPGDEITLLHTHPHKLNSPLEKIDPGKKIQNYTPFDATLNMEPYMTPGHSPIQDMKLLGIISHQGTKDNGHYTAMTRREDKWTLYNDAIATQTTTKHIYQTKAYILMYGRTEERIGMVKSAPIDIPEKLESQSGAKENPNPRLETQPGWKIVGKGAAIPAGRKIGSIPGPTPVHLGLLPP